jgi:acyl carrier protein
MTTTSGRHSVDARDDIRRFIQDQLLSGDGSAPIADDTPLFEGIIDSIGLIDLVGFLETRFGIQIGDEDFSNENFRTIEAIEQLVSRRAAEG